MGTATKQRELTANDIEDGYYNDEWLGFGYLGMRTLRRRSEQDRADAVVLEHANAHGWTPERLFTWMNSRDGRHFGDNAFGGWSDDDLAKNASSYFKGY